MDPVTLVGQRLVLNAPTHDDAETVATLCDDVTWAIRERADGAMLGVISWRRERGDVGFWLGAPSRGHGLMIARATGFAFTGERPFEIVHRDGSHPHSWHAVLDRDDRDVHPVGWPL